ncbi:MAG: hypothetical protein WA981_04170 [Glaciecola sp.]
MRAFRGMNNKVRLLLTASLVLWLGMANAQTQDQSSIGVFQFVASTIDVVGLEDDVSYIVRNELRKAPNLVVINQRELELALSRNDIQQTYSDQEAVKAATVLNLNYVIIGRVSREGQQIVANVDIVSPINAASIDSLKFTFNNQAQIALQATYIGESLATAIAAHIVDAKASVKSLGEDWVNSISANYNNGLVTVEWTLADPEVGFLGFNLYRATSEQGPFSYISSESELSSKDNPGTDAATYYYQLSMVNEDGEEIRSEKLASVVVEEIKLSSLFPPTVVNTTERVNGIALEFFPSSENVGKAILGYELVRRSEASDWVVVNTYNLPVANSSSQSNSGSPNSIKKFTLSDTQSAQIDGPVSYAVRAFSQSEKGQMTDAIDYTPATAPQLQLASNSTLREIAITWQPASAGFGYRIYRKAADESDWMLLQELPQLQTNTYTDTNIEQESQSFKYAISVFDDFGETSKSAPFEASSKASLEPPSQVKGTSGLARKAIINWLPITDPDVAGYSVFRAPYTEDEEFTLTRIGEITDPLATTFTDDSALQDNTAYYYSVASINRFNSSGPVSQAVLVTTKEPPLPVSSVVANLQNNQVQLSWDLPTTPDIKTIQIERSFDGQVFDKIASLEVSSGKATQFSDANLLSGAEQVYRLMVIDSDGLTSAPASSNALSIDLPLALNVPTDGMLRKISLAWENAMAPALIKLYRGTDQQNLALINEIEGLTKSNYIDETDLIDDQTYFVKIESWLNGNKLAESDIVTSTTKDIPAPQNLVAVSNLPKRISLSWDAVNDESIQQYVVFRRPAGTDNSQLVSIAQIKSSSTTEFTDEMFTQRTTQLGDSIEHGKEYEYAIASKNVFDATGFIGEIVSASSKKLPQAPSQVNVSTTTEAVELTWQQGDESDLVTTVIERKWPFETTFTKIAEVSPSTSSYKDTSLYPYASPEYRLSIVDKDDLVSAFTRVNDINNLKNVSLNVEAEGLLRELTIAWDDTSSNISVVVNRRKAGTTNWTSLATVSAATGNYNDTNNLADQTEYEYKLILQTSAEQPFVLGESNIVSARTKDLPPAPNLTAVSDLVKQVDLTWEIDTDKDVAGYNLYKVNDAGELELLETFKRQESSYADNGTFFSKLSDGSAYNYKIAAFNTFKVEGLHGELVSATTKAVPTAPQGLSAQLSGSTVVLSWLSNPQTDIVTYEIYRGSTCNRVSAVAKVSANGNLNYEDSSAKSGRDYCYKLKAIDSTELESGLSGGAQISTPEAAE